MAAPSYLNVGTAAVSAGATSRAPALPASRTNGNILIAVVGSKNNATHSISGSGWASLASQTNSGTGFTVSYWWRIVDGTEAAPTISWTGSAACFGQIVQYTRQNSDTAAPFGTIGTAGTGTTSTHTSTGFNSTRNNSLIIYLDAAVANTALGTPTNWTERFDAGSTTSVTRHAGGDRTITTSGGSSGNISVTGAAAAWVQRQIEILEPILTGTLSASETGSDTASFTGLVEITGSLAATETGSDTFAANGGPVISGTLAAQESGSDVLAASGTVLSAISGSLAAQESGADTFDAAGSVADPQPEPEPAPAEVNWPGTTISRSQFKAMQRAALARALAEARREQEEAPKPVKKSTRKAARRVLRVMAADGLLSNASLSRAEKPLAQAIAGTISFQDLMSQFDAMLQEMEARQQAIIDQYEDEAIALLLLAA